ncbi:HAMP domain-containing histidine kinase [Nocardioides guangzhouensis]|uniref:histidine kinase n=1 Tax=Nocardioides guangzhouensis TaxID=2497878 RepID=A0A4Q4Z124_9ACTN|nr:HAMP domain-containing sensor histidine kinase [Nocardioides guangzhouensis]RYP80825.1 HAMP domain-containing histidine kinase [Nocardioides guangzhouensis]
MDGEVTEPVPERRWLPTSFRTRIMLSAVALAGVVTVLAGLGIQLVLEVTASRDIERVLEDRADAVVTVVRSGSDDGSLVPEDGLDPGVALYDGRARLLSGSLPAAARPKGPDLARDALADGGTRTLELGEDVRLRVVPLTTESGKRAVVVVSEDLAPYERSEVYAFVTTTILGVLLIGLTALLARRITSQALAPVTRMAERAEEWSEHDLGHRFAMGPPTNELAALGATLDHLLDRVAHAIRSEQRLTSELAHELRTPLTTIQGSADLALLRGVDDPATREDLEQVAASARELAEVVTTLLDLARDVQADGSCHVADLREGIRGLVPDGVALDDRTGTSRARIAAPRALVLRALAPLVENAARHATSRVTVTATDAADAVLVTVADDGPGMDEATRAALFRPGASSSGGTGLGLAISRRVARSLGGDVLLDDTGDAGRRGAVFALRLPLL